MAVQVKDVFLEAESIYATAASMPPIPAQEAKLRTALHCAYYAAYHRCLRWARRNGFKPADAPPEYIGSHEKLWDWWVDKQVCNRALATLGNSIKGNRITADYHLNEHISAESVRIVIEGAKKLISDINSLDA